MVSLKQLRYFDAVARTGHFGDAARQCGVTQPALSMQIQELERGLGVQLLERDRRGVTLTAGGREVAERASRVLADVRDLADCARRQAGMLSGSLHLGVIPTIAPYLLPPLLPRIREAYPELDLHLRETQTQTLVRELVEGQLDLLLLALPVEHPGIETAPLFEDRFVLAAPRSRRLPADVRASPDRLRHERLLLLEEGHCLRAQALEVCDLRQSDRIDTFGASSLSTLVQMVAHGLGMTLLPELSLDLEGRNRKIRLVRFAEPEPLRVIGLAWRASSPRKSEFAALGDLVRAARSRRRAPVPA